MPPSRYVRLTDEEDERLRQIEQDAFLNPKVRLRAQVLRLPTASLRLNSDPPYAPR